MRPLTIIVLLSATALSCNGKFENLQEKKEVVAKTVTVVLGLEKKAKQVTTQESNENLQATDHEEPKSFFWDSKFLLQ